MRRLVPALLLSVSVITAGTTPPRVALADPIADAQARQSRLNAAITREKAALANVRDQQARTQAQVNLLGDQISLAEANLATQNAKLDGVLGDIDKSNRDLAAKKVEEAQRQDLLNRRMRILYKQDGTMNFLDAIFTARTFSELMDRFLVMRDITHSDEILLQQIQADRAAIESLNIQLGQKRDEQAAVVKGIKDQTDALQAQYIQYGVLRGQLAAEAVSLEAQQRANQAAADAVTAQIAELQAARSRAHSSGVFAWPGVQGPITQGFGCSSLGGEPKPLPGYSCHPMGTCVRPPVGCFHMGIDIGGPEGSEIDATDGGIAYTTLGSSGGYGNFVVIIHANGFSSLYGHMLRNFAVSNGQAVAKGQRIGYEGNTGWSFGAHLHFEIRLNDVPVNPCRYVGC